MSEEKRCPACNHPLTDLVPKENGKLVWLCLCGTEVPAEPGDYRKEYGEA